MRRSSALAVLVLVAAIGACSDGSADRDEYVDAVVESFGEDDEDIPIDAAGQECAAAALVDAVGVDRLEEADLSPADLAGADDLEDAGIDVETGDQEALSAGLAACDLDWSEFFAESLAGEGGLVFTNAATDCLRTEIMAGPEDALADGLARALIGDPPDDAEMGLLLLEPLGRCPRVLAELMAVGVAEAGGSPSAELIDCFEREIAARGPGIAQTFLDASTDPAVAQAVGAELGAACL